MIPIEPKKELLTLPETDNHSIVIITGDSIRHKRFAYRLISAFPNQVLSWYELEKRKRPKNNKKRNYLDKLKKKLSSSFIVMGKNGICYCFQLILKSFFKSFYYKPLIKKYSENSKKIEKSIFLREIIALKKQVTIKPKRVDIDKVNSKPFIKEIENLDPYFLVTLGGPIYKNSLINKIRGVALNQHAGHSPNYRGSYTTEWALYHRQINKISSTIHIITSGVDSGPIIRRSNPLIMPYDDVGTIFNRVVALGTELMIETINNIIKDKNIFVIKQSTIVGKTYLAKEFTYDIKKTLLIDYKKGFLKDELNRVSDF